MVTINNKKLIFWLDSKVFTMYKNSRDIMNKKGFTIIELMTVIAIMGVMTTLAFTSWRNYTIKTRLSRVEREILSTLRQAKTIAITTGITQCVLFNKEDGGYRTGPDSTNTGDSPNYGNLVSLPDGVIIDNKDDVKFVFFPDHTARAVNIRIKDQAGDGRSKKFYVLPATGYVGVEDICE